MTIFLIGMTGAFAGGLMLVGAVYVAYLVEVNQRKKAIINASKEINGLLNELKGLSHSSAKDAGKYN